MDGGNSVYILFLTRKKLQNTENGLKKIPTLGTGEIMQSGDTCTRDGWRKISLHSIPDPKNL
jgi:hypothetical protein